jgi:hypothetical protein
MSKSQKSYLVAFFGFSLVAIFLLATSLSNIHFKPGKSLDLINWFFDELGSENQPITAEMAVPPDRSTLLPDVGEAMLQSLIILFWMMTILSVLLIIVSPKFRKEFIRIFAMIIPLVILLPQIANSLADQSSNREDEAAAELAMGEVGRPEPPAFIVDPPEWLFFGVNIILFLLFVVGIYLLIRRLRPKPDAQAVVVKQVQKTLKDLDSGVDFNNAIIICYSQMCQGLQSSQNIQRKKNMTPREFEVMLAEAGIFSKHIQQLTLLFEGVRYGAKTTDSVSEKQAKQYLQIILQTYG